MMLYRCHDQFYKVDMPSILLTVLRGLRRLNVIRTPTRDGDWAGVRIFSNIYSLFAFGCRPVAEMRQRTLLIFDENPCKVGILDHMRDTKIREVP